MTKPFNELRYKLDVDLVVTKQRQLIKEFFETCRLEIELSDAINKKELLQSVDELETNYEKDNKKPS